MWLILTCWLGCTDGVDPERAAGWIAEAALTGERPWRTDLWDGVAQLEGRRFATQRECLRALRRAYPERDDEFPDAYGQLTFITHYPDFVEETQVIPEVQVGTGYYACFRASPRVS